MTKLLEEAVSKVRELSEESQDALAITMLSMADINPSTFSMDEETVMAIREGVEQARRGEAVSDEKIEALWSRFDA